MLVTNQPETPIVLRISLCACFQDGSVQNVPNHAKGKHKENES